MADNHVLVIFQCKNITLTILFLLQGSEAIVLNRAEFLAHSYVGNIKTPQGFLVPRPIVLYYSSYVDHYLNTRDSYRD